MNLLLLAQVIAPRTHADHGSNVVGIAAVLVSALVVVLLLVAYATRPPRQ